MQHLIAMEKLLTLNEWARIYTPYLKRRSVSKEYVKQRESAGLTLSLILGEICDSSMFKFGFVYNNPELAVFLVLF